MTEAVKNRHLDKKAGRVYVDIEGQLSDENRPDLLSLELTPDEKIVREFRVYESDEGIPTWKLALFSIMTLGLFLCYVYCCNCCRTLAIGNMRTRAALTDRGRLVYWKSHIDGERQGEKGLANYSSGTTVDWIHVDDVNSMQVGCRRWLTSQSYVNACVRYSSCSKLQGDSR
eukprot:gb/GECG01010869.1/.p1 GENE.gb/GECG01010869.1/~~gb/GECG01010869.1/.p1  ORF type:complete len:172 (+),score=9.21 gb/GECG01010869.1/:1-516(+)